MSRSSSLVSRCCCLTDGRTLQVEVVECVTVANDKRFVVVFVVCFAGVVVVR